MRLRRISIVAALIVGGALRAQVKQGDWVVRGEETVRDTTVVLTGHLIVEAGGSLTLENVTLVVPAATPAVRMEARAGAKLTLVDSVLKPGAEGVLMSLTVTGAEFRMVRTRLEGVRDAQPWEGDGGLTVRDSVAPVLEGNTIAAAGATGVQLERVRNATLKGNRFVFPETGNAGTALRLTDAHWNSVEENTFVRAAAVVSGGHANDFVNNDVWLAGEFPGFVFWGGSGYNYVAGNRFRMDPDSAPSCFAVRVVSTPYPNYVVGNTVEGPRYAFLVSYATGTVVAGNMLTGLTDPNTAAVHVFHSRGTRILNNEILTSQVGVLLSGGQDNVVRGNGFRNSRAGVWVVESRGNAVEGNDFERNQENIALTEADGNRIAGNNLYLQMRQSRDTGANEWTGNYFSDRPAGLKVYPIGPVGVDWSPAEVPLELARAEVPEVVKDEPALKQYEWTVIQTDTVWENCERELGGGFLVDGGATLTVRNCKLRASEGLSGLSPHIGVTPGSGLVIENSTVEGDGVTTSVVLGTGPGARLVLRNSRFRHLSTWASGVDLTADGAVIEGSEFEGGYLGLRIEGSRGHRITGNRFRGGFSGISVFDRPVEDSILEGNVFEGNLLNGLGGTFVRSRIEGNLFTSSMVGLGFGGEDNVLRGNVVLNSTRGVQLGGTGNRMTQNVLMGNGGWWAVQLWRLTAEDRGRGNSWAENYWSEYAGEDKDGNGLGDSPHRSLSGVEDGSPMMQPKALGECRLSYLAAQELWLPSDGGARTVEILAPAGCEWASDAGVEWVAVEYRGNQAVVTAAGNPTDRFRTGAATVAGRRLRVYQPPAGCWYKVSAAGQEWEARAGAGRVGITAPAGCPWTVENQTEWLQWESTVTFGSGDGEVRFWFGENPGGARKGWLSVAGERFEVRQKGVK